jgi:DNA recombination protein RmuC
MLIAFLIGLLLATAGAAAAYLATRLRLHDVERTLRLEAAARSSAETHARELEPELAALRERLAVLGDVKGQLEDRFKLLAGDVLEKSSQSLVDSTKQLLEPLRLSVERVDRQAQELEQSRRQAYGALTQQLRTLTTDQERLRAATATLASALRTPHVRGRWGEVQLKRVIEYAGMVAHCDFVEQTTTADPDGRLLRPDVVIKLPGGKNVVIDAKTPLDAYLSWLEADDGERDARLADHARQVRDHVNRLAAKRYWTQFQPAPDFVVMFVPDETFLRAAHEHDATIHEAAWKSNVIVASPTNLITLLRTIAAIWQQETAAENARKIGELGRELYDRMGTLGKHVAKLGRSLDGAVGAYNETVGSLEGRVLVTARKLNDHGIGSEELPQIPPLERQSRPLQSLELTVDGTEPPVAEAETLLELPSVAADAA